MDTTTSLLSSHLLPPHIVRDILTNLPLPQLLLLSISPNSIIHSQALYLLFKHLYIVNTTTNAIKPRNEFHINSNDLRLFNNLTHFTTKKLNINLTSLSHNSIQIEDFTNYTHFTNLSYLSLSLPLISSPTQTNNIPILIKSYDNLISNLILSNKSTLSHFNLSFSNSSQFNPFINLTELNLNFINLLNCRTSKVKVSFNLIYQKNHINPVFYNYNENENPIILLKNSNQLSSLNLSKNGITKIEHFFNKSSQNNLTHLNLSYNNISKLNNLSNLHNLTHLNLSNNNITKLENINKLTNLRCLNLSSNHILKIENLNKLTNLQCLNLSNNSIVNFEKLNRLPNLQCLNLSKNLIHSIKFTLTKNKVNNFINLTQLDLSVNKINLISKIEYLVNLTDLNLYSNEISTLTDLDLNQLGQLTNLNLSYNKIKKIHNYSLNGFNGLNNLNLKSNLINQFQINNHNSLLKLEELVLSYNQIESIEIITPINDNDNDYNHCSLKNLKILCMNNNSIENFEFLNNFEFKLKKIDLSYNLINQFKFIKHCERLEEISLNVNKINEIENNLLKKNEVYPILKKLNLKRNLISKIDGLQHFKKLKYLDLSSNKIQSLNINEKKNLNENLNENLNQTMNRGSRLFIYLIGNNLKMGDKNSYHNVNVNGRFASLGLNSTTVMIN